MISTHWSRAASLSAAHAFGETDPVASNDTPGGQAKNRLVDILLTGDGKIIRPNILFFLTIRPETDHLTRTPPKTASENSGYVKGVLQRRYRGEKRKVTGHYVRRLIIALTWALKRGRLKVLVRLDPMMIAPVNWFNNPTI